jgi:hypothetical protein
VNADRLPSGSVLSLSDDDLRTPLPDGPNFVVYGYIEGREPRISRKLWNLMLAEFRRNGRRILTRGKVAHLRRVIRRGRAPR